jgi:hypothetical protein
MSLNSPIRSRTPYAFARCNGPPSVLFLQPPLSAFLPIAPYAPCLFGCHLVINEHAFNIRTESDTKSMTRPVNGSLFLLNGRKREGVIPEEQVQPPV